MAVIAVLGTFDTKGRELDFVAQTIRGLGHQPLLIDVGTLDPPQFPPDISREEVAAAGKIDLAQLNQRRDRGECVAAMSQAAPAICLQLLAEKRLEAVISLGGGGGTTIGTAAMRALPIGIPKLMVSTRASSDVSAYVGSKDIVMFPSIVDISGLNEISRLLFAQAAAAICGMVSISAHAELNDRPLIVASMFGNTTKCVTRAQQRLEQSGYEVLVFHATGVGGQTMESLICSGRIQGVLDLTTTEWADELVGGILSAGRTRLDAAAQMKVPAVIAPGCLDMVNFGAPESVPARFAGRRMYQHNPQTTLMRTSISESAELGNILAAKLNQYGPRTAVLWPLRGLSVIGAEGGPFYDPAADAAMLQSLKAQLRADIPLIEMDNAINDPAFAEACAAELLRLLALSKPAA